MTRKQIDKLPRNCECGGKLTYAFLAGRAFSVCDRCSPITRVHLQEPSR